MKIEKGNLKCVNTFYLFGYENLRFPEIEEIISNYVRLHKPFRFDGKICEQKDIITSNPLQVSKPALKNISLNNNTSNSRISTPTTSTGKPVPSQPISLYEYSLKLDKITSGDSVEESVSRHSDLETDHQHSNGKPDARHSDTVLKKVPDSYQRNVEDYKDPMVIWIILYMIHLILTDHQDDKEWYDRPVGTPISSRVLEDIFGNRRKIALAKEIVEYANIMERFPAIPEDHISDRFKISIALRNKRQLGRAIRYPVDDPKVSRLLIDAFNRRLDKKPQDAVSKKSLKTLQTLRIRGEEARKFIDDNYNKEYSREMSKNKPNTARLARLQAKKDNRYAFIQSVEHIEEDAFVTRDDFSGRLYSTFTMSPKALRQFLYFEGCNEDLYIVDLSNAMAVLMVLILIEHYQNHYWKEYELGFESVITFLQLLREKGDCDDVIQFITLVMNGRFYDEMHRLMYIGGENLPMLNDKVKKKLKTSLCRHVFYGKNWWQKRFPYKANVEKVFEANFPNVYKVVEDIKCDDYKELAKVLFKKEVSIIIDGILKELIWKGKKPYILSIHDGLLCRGSDVQEVVDSLAMALKKWDLQVSISIEKIRTGEMKKEILNELPDWERLPLIKYRWKGQECAMRVKVV